MKCLREHWLKLGVIICGLLSILLTNSYFQQKNRLSEEKVLRDQPQTSPLPQQRKGEVDRKLAIDQKDACLAIYNEISKWNNTNGWRYDSDIDTCYIQYEETPKKSEAQCDDNYQEDDGKVLPQFIRNWILCKVGLFEIPF